MFASRSLSITLHTSNKSFHLSCCSVLFSYISCFYFVAISFNLFEWFSFVYIFFLKFPNLNSSALSWCVSVSKSVVSLSVVVLWLVMEPNAWRFMPQQIQVSLNLWDVKCVRWWNPEIHRWFLLAKSLQKPTRWNVGRLANSVWLVNLLNLLDDRVDWLVG